MEDQNYNLIYFLLVLSVRKPAVSWYIIIFINVKHFKIFINETFWKTGIKVLFLGLFCKVYHFQSRKSWKICFNWRENAGILNYDCVNTLIYDVDKKWQILSPPPLHPQKWTKDLLFKNNRIHKPVTNFKTPVPPLLSVGVLKVWSFRAFMGILLLVALFLFSSMLVY